MSFELLSTVPIGPDTKGQFRFIVVMSKSEEETEPTLPVPTTGEVPGIFLVSGAPMMPSIPVSVLPVPVSASIPVRKSPELPKKEQYAPFPEFMEKSLQRYVDLKEFPVLWNATPIKNHPAMGPISYGGENLKLVIITLPRRHIARSYEQEELSEWLEGKTDTLMAFLAKQGLAIVKKAPNCHCDNYCPGQGCGYKSTKEMICLNCAPLCPVCLEPVASLYDNGIGGGCYDCLN